jgi:integrase
MDHLVDGHRGAASAAAKGRRSGPVFTTKRPSRVTPAVLDGAPDGTTRLSYRRAEELFKAHAGATLHQLRHSALTHMAEDGASAPMLMTKSRNQSIAILAATPAPASRPSSAGRPSTTPPGGAADHQMAEGCPDAVTAGCLGLCPVTG